MQDGNGKRAIIGAVQALLEGPEPAAALAECVFADANPHDLDCYAPAALAECARIAARHLSCPREGGADIRLVDLRAEVDGRRRELTVLQVVNDDMPFLLDSTLAELSERGLSVRFVVHPVLAVARDAAGGLLRFAKAHGPRGSGEKRESLIQIHIDRMDEAAAREGLVAALAAVYRDVARAVNDWPAMRERVTAAIEAYRFSPPPLPADEIEEARVLLSWLEEGNFTLLGVRDYRIPAGEESADPIAGSGLGILADPEVKVLKRGGEMVTITPEIRAFLAEPVPLIVTKASVRSRVHRRAYLDYVGVKLFDAAGALSGELVLVGLFTATAYTETVGAIPFIRRKVARVVAMAEYDPASHSGRALLNVLENYPRDELFQVDEATLLRFALDILAVYDRPRVKALARTDRYGRFVSILVFVPKDRYDTDTRIRIGNLLAALYGGRLSAAYPAYPDGPLARTHFIVGRDGGDVPELAPAALDEAVATVVRTWADNLREALDERLGGARGRALAARYADAFSAAYREGFSPAKAIADIGVIERLAAERPRAVRFDRREGDVARVNLEVFARGFPLPLSVRVPLLESMGLRVLDERTHRIVPAGAKEEERVWLHDMLLERAAGGFIDVDVCGDRLETALMALLGGHAAPDGYNALTLEAGLGWRDVQLLRALSRYLLQIRVPFSHDYMAATLVKHPALAAKTVALFYARFDPREEDRTGRVAALGAEIETALDAVASLDEDRILRHFVDVVEAAERTSFFRLGANGLPTETLAIKIASRAVEGMPSPKPLHEIFVYGRKVEGVHLRFGPVARGGLRWSDRKEDYRTEVLGLVKAQQVKNAVIVPVGAKGGFIPKELPSPTDRQAYMAEGIAAYREFVGALLDVTDDLRGGEIVPPLEVVRHDGDDPYLVVAADKGTATFSDIANGLAVERGFWLGDAFASGGSNGYDHKGMGITARGAWEAVKRHFREIDVDVQTAPVTVAGVGDMSGDVFGNGMLLSPSIRLVAAFDHRDIFIDPNPDPTLSLAERRRLFALPRSSWADYDATLISAGGGVWSRNLKSIPLSAEIRALLDLDAEDATPQEIMTAILSARVDLLWFGGIGTYIRASTETDAQAGDRANDAIRISGAQVRATVIGEGANLGVTQRGRIEAALRGIRLNTDAIDNSAGVNTSDVEVNIKIALAVPTADGRLDEDARKALLATMTDEVAGLVLANNRRQTLALSLAERRGREAMPDLLRSLRALEAAGRLDRSVEFLPDDVQLAEREKRGLSLTRPELAVLLAYEKLALKDALVASTVPDDAFFTREIEAYFPRGIVARFPDAVRSHRLRRNIVATRLANLVVDRGGIGFITAMESSTGVDAAGATASLAAVWSLFGMADRFKAVDELGSIVSGSDQLAFYDVLRRFVGARAAWLARMSGAGTTVEAVIARFAPAVAQLAVGATTDAPPPVPGTPDAAAQSFAELKTLADALDVTLVAERTSGSLTEAAEAFRIAGSETGLARVAEAGQALVPADRFERMAAEGALARIAEARRTLAAARISGGDGVLTSMIAALVQDVASGPITQARLTVLADAVSVRTTV